MRGDRPLAFRAEDKNSNLIAAELLMSIPITAIPELSLCDIACSSSSAPLASFACWRGRSTGSLIDHLAVILMAAAVVLVVAAMLFP